MPVVLANPAIWNFGGRNGACDPGSVVAPSSLPADPADRRASFYSEKVILSNDDPSGEDFGAGFFALRKQGGTAYSNVLTAYGEYGDGSGDMAASHSRVHLIKTNPVASPFAGWDFASICPGVTAYGGVTARESNIQNQSKVASRHPSLWVSGHMYVGDANGAVIHNLISERTPGQDQTPYPITCIWQTGRNYTQNPDGTYIDAASPLRSGWVMKPDSIFRDPATNTGEHIYHFGSWVLNTRSPNWAALDRNFFNALDFTRASFAGAVIAFGPPNGTSGIVMLGAPISIAGHNVSLFQKVTVNNGATQGLVPIFLASDLGVSW